MHALSFRLKRAHLRAVEMHKPLAALFDLTPARFDVMVVIRGRGGSCWQSTIAEELGVSRVTIGRMVEAMEKRGLVWRDEDRDDRRQVTVALTTRGFDCIVRAIKAFIRADQLRAFYDAMHPDGHDFVVMAVKMLRHVGRALFDTSRHSYLLDAPDAATIAEADGFNERVWMEVERLEAHYLARMRAEEDAYDPILPSHDDLIDSDFEEVDRWDH